MKVVFLDIDGVLNNHATKEMTPDKWLGVDDSLFARFAKVVKELDLTIVLTSTWKDDWENKAPDGKYLDAKFSAHGLKITDRTYEQSWSQRGTGIRKYLSEHDVEAYVIIDDNEFLDFTGELWEHFVMTNPATGLTDADVEKMKRIIKC